MAKSTSSTTANDSGSSIDYVIDRVCDELNDPRTTPAERQRYREIAKDAIASTTKNALCVALLLLTLTGQALATHTPSAPRQGVPDCLNQADKNGPRPGCG